MDASLPASRARCRLGRSLLWAYQTIAFYGVLMAFGLVFLGWNLPATVLYFVLPRPRSVRVGQYVIMRGSVPCWG